MTFQEFWLELMMILTFLNGLVSLKTLGIVCKFPEGVMFKIWMKSDEFEGI